MKNTVKTTIENTVRHLSKNLGLPIKVVFSDESEPNFTIVYLVADWTYTRHEEVKVTKVFRKFFKKYGILTFSEDAE